MKDKTQKPGAVDFSEPYEHLKPEFAPPDVYDPKSTQEVRHAAETVAAGRLSPDAGVELDPTTHAPNTCRTCKHSQDAEDGRLWCNWFGAEAVKVCENWTKRA